jgi:hypothetical protein
MVFVPTAAVYHQHADSLLRYLKKKFKFAFWRVLAVSKNPTKAVKDSHTPQLMKIQVLFVPLVVLAGFCDVFRRSVVPFSAIACLIFVLSTLPFSLRALRKDRLIGILSPFILFARSCAQLSGVVLGASYFLLIPSTRRVLRAIAGG